jgi:hypothetical protein
VQEPTAGNQERHKGSEGEQPPLPPGEEGGRRAGWVGRWEDPVNRPNRFRRKELGNLLFQPSTFLDELIIALKDGLESFPELPLVKPRNLFDQLLVGRELLSGGIELLRTPL